MRLRLLRLQFSVAWFVRLSFVRRIRAHCLNRWTNLNLDGSP